MLQSHPDVPMRYIAFDDIAAVAVTALTTHQYDNTIVSVQGPAPITIRQQLTHISALLNQPIEVVQVSEEQYKQHSGAPASLVDSVHILQRFRAEKGADYQAQTDALVTGSTTFEQFVAANRNEYNVDGDAKQGQSKRAIYTELN